MSEYCLLGSSTISSSFIDLRESRSRGEIVLERFDALFASLDEGFHRAVFQILYITVNLMPRGRTLREKSKSDPLHSPANEKFPSNNH